MKSLARRVLLTVALTSLTVLALPLLAETVVGSGRVQTESRSVASFSAVLLEASVKVVVRQSGAESVQLRADDNLLPLIETVVESRSGQPTLVVRWKRGTSTRHGSDIEILVDATTVNGLAVSGSGTIEAGPLRADRLKLALAGSGDIVIRDLTADEVSTSIAGSGDVSVGGSANEARVSIAGSGDADLSRLIANDVRVSIAGSGDADVTAERSLVVKVAGSGDVTYGGAVTDIKKSVAGSGDVSRR